MTSLLDRVVVPDRLALITRGGEYLGYNPGANVWHRIDEDTAEALRWLRAGRSPDDLPAHLRRRFGRDFDVRLGEILNWALLRRLLYLDRQPEIPPVALPEHPLSAVYWITTQKCNLRCTYCYQDAARARPAELTTAEAERLVDQAVRAGATTFIFTGGEPFSRRDLLQVAAYSRAAGLRTNVITNGAYINPGNIDRVAETFHLVTVSLDHIIPEHHDRIRGNRSWQKAVRAIDLLLAAGVPVDVNTVLSRYGLADLKELLTLSRVKRIGQHKIVPQFPMGRGGDHRGDELTAEELLALNDDISRLQHHQGGQSESGAAVHAEGSGAGKGVRRAHCGAGLSEVSVDPEGWVYPCKLLQYPQFRTANVRDQELTDIYRTHPILRSIQQATTEHLQPCDTCLIRNDCGGGCRGIHHSFPALDTDAAAAYNRAEPLFCAYLRRSFEVKAWNTTGGIPGPRKAGFVRDDRPPPVFLPMPAFPARP